MTNDELVNNFNLILASGYDSEEFSEDMELLREDIIATREEILARTESNAHIHEQAKDAMGGEATTYIYDPWGRGKSTENAISNNKEKTIRIFMPPSSKSKFINSRDPWGERFLDISHVQYGAWGNASETMRHGILNHEFRHLMKDNMEITTLANSLQPHKYARHESDARRFQKYMSSKYFDFKDYKVPEKRF